MIPRINSDSIVYIYFVQNSGCTHGRIVRRSRVLKNVDKHEYYSWKDLNIGIDLSIFGIKYHLLDCDPFTRVSVIDRLLMVLRQRVQNEFHFIFNQEFLKSNGIEINELEPRPEPAARPKTALARIPASMRLGTNDSCVVKMAKKSCEGIVLSYVLFNKCARVYVTTCITFQYFQLPLRSHRREETSQRVRFLYIKLFR